MGNRKQYGSALISALFIMTLVAIAATALTTRLQLEIYHVQLSIESNKLHLASEIVPFWAMSRLVDKQHVILIGDSEGKVLDFPTLLNTSYPEFKITGQVYDLQARFNINNLSSSSYRSVFLNLLKPHLSLKKAMALYHATTHWISPLQPGRDNQLLNYYLKQLPPYVPSHQFLQNPSEFRLIKEVNAPLYKKISKFISTLPENTPININTASPQILSLLGKGLQSSEITALLEARGKKGIKDFRKINPLIKKANINTQHLAFESQYFLSVARVSSSNLNFINYTVIKRKKNIQGNYQVSIISESYNVFDA